MQILLITSKWDLYNFAGNQISSSAHGDRANKQAKGRKQKYMKVGYTEIIVMV